MTTETEELLWIASQEHKLIPREIVLFGIKNKKTLFELLTSDPLLFEEIDKKTVEKFLKNREELQFESYHTIYEKMQQHHVNLITYCDPIFPKFLQKENVRGFPIMLYHQGKKIKFDNGIAVVGTRNCSTHASETAREISRRLAHFGYTIVAGLARGIDVSAHRGAISVKGKTIAVLPWIHEPYPPEHERLLTEIKKDGCVISENFFQSKWNDKYKFLERNAVISGISDVLIAVESSYSGGTRWQVELALSQNKPVIAMEPEKENELAYDGFMRFINKGAIKGNNVSEVVEIIKQKFPLKETSLDDYTDEDEISLPPLRKATA